MVFWNRGTPKSSILTGFFSLINHPFWVPFNWHFPALLPIRGEHDKISHGGLGHPRTSSFDVSRSATELAAEKIPIGWCIDGNAPKPEGHGVFITYRKTERVVLNILDSVTPGKKNTSTKRGYETTHQELDVLLDCSTWKPTESCVRFPPMVAKNLKMTNASSGKSFIIHVLLFGVPVSQVDVYTHYIDIQICMYIYIYESISTSSILVSCPCINVFYMWPMYVMCTSMSNYTVCIYIYVCIHVLN